MHLRAFFRQIDARASGSVRTEEFKVSGAAATFRYTHVRQLTDSPLLTLVGLLCRGLLSQAGLRLMNVRCEGEQIGEAQIEGLVDFLDPRQSGIVGYDEFFEGLRVQTM